jgi:hypothetical protein
MSAEYQVTQLASSSTLTGSSFIFILLTVGGAAVALLRWFAARVLAQIEQRMSRVEAIEEQIAADVRDHTVRIARLESIAATAPSHEDLSKMYQSIHQLGQTVHQLVGENRGQSDSLRLILSRLTEKPTKPMDSL